MKEGSSCVGRKLRSIARRVRQIILRGSIVLFFAACLLVRTLNFCLAQAVKQETDATIVFAEERVPATSATEGGVSLGCCLDCGG